MPPLDVRANKNTGKPIVCQAFTRDLTQSLTALFALPSSAADDVRAQAGSTRVLS